MRLQYGPPGSQAFDGVNRISSFQVAGSQILSCDVLGQRQPTDEEGADQRRSRNAGATTRIGEIVDANAATVRDVQYQRSPIGNKLAVVRPDLGKQSTYAYNSNSWITNESLGIPLNVTNPQPSVSTTWTPDKALNYTSIVRNGAATATTINKRNEYTSFGNESLSYDANGNLAVRSGKTLRYDFENRLKKTTLSDGTTVENLYDADGRKVEEKVTIGTTTKATDYVLDGDQVIEQYLDGDITARYVRGRGIDETVRAETSSSGHGNLDETIFPLQDELGNVERLTDESGATVERYEYEGYGKFSIFGADGSPLSSSAYGWNWLFQGREYQPILSAYDFRARHLWPDLGRFGQEDPLEGPECTAPSSGLSGDWNSFSDPSGEVVVLMHGIKSDAPWAGEMALGLRQRWRSDKADKHQDVIKLVNRQRNGSKFGALNASRAGNGTLDADKMAAGFRTARFLARLRALYDTSKGRKGEQINIIAHSHGTAILLAAARQMHLTLGIVTLAGSDLDPATDISTLVLSASHVFNYYSAADATTGMIAAAGNRSFSGNWPQFTQVSVPGVKHYRSDTERGQGVMSWMSQELARSLYAVPAELPTDVGSLIDSETWPWIKEYINLRAEMAGVATDPQLPLK